MLKNESFLKRSICKVLGADGIIDDESLKKLGKGRWFPLKKKKKKTQKVVFIDVFPLGCKLPKGEGCVSPL